MRRVLLAALLVVACTRSKPDADELGKVAATEKSLEDNEEDLLSQRGSLQRERKKLTDERQALAEKRKTASGSERAALDSQEQQLSAKESDLQGKESSLNTKLDELLRQRAEMVQRATAAAASGTDPGAQVARRESTVALREKDFARREAEIARRESDLAGRERELVKREREGCTQATQTIIKTEIPKGLKYGRHEVEPVYRKALKVMQDKGILASDLPPGTARLVDDARSAMESGDYVRAKYAADQLLDVVNELHVDRSFIGAKMNRLSTAMRGKTLPGERRKEVDSLLQEATAAYGDGKFTQANTKINRIFALLH
jgi:chromosome segregation ATPase